MSHKLQTLARHPGRFSLTVDEGNSGNNYDFLAVALHYFDGGPMNALLDLFAKERNKNVGETDLGFSGDIRCVRHVFNLVTEAFLSFTFFKTKKTKKFETILQKAQEDHPTLCELLPKLRSSPGVIRSILNGIRHNHFLKNNFRKLVQERNSSEEDDTVRKKT